MPEIFGVKIIQDLCINRFEELLNYLPDDKVLKIKNSEGMRIHCGL